MANSLDNSTALLSTTGVLPEKVQIKVTDVANAFDFFGKKYTVYIIQVNYGNITWTIQRRFSDFVKFGKEVKRLNKSIASMIPSRSFMSISSKSKLVQQRRLEIGEFLLALASEQVLLDLEATQQFFELDIAYRRQSLPTTPEIAAAKEDHQRISLGGVDKASPADFRFLTFIGKGSVAKVMKAEHRVTGTLYAIKTVNKKDIVKRKEVKHIMAERAILQRNHHHPFLIKMHYAFQTSQKLYFVLDFVNGGELFRHLSHERAFSLERSRLYTAEMALALGFLHKQRVIYRDLKPENILLDMEGHIVLIDFGLCCVGERAATFCGTPEYLAPDVLRKSVYTFAVDWWCLGCILYEMLTGLPPFYNEDHSKMYNAILNAPLTFPEKANLTADTKSFISGLLDKDPGSRLGSGKDDVAEIQQHAFFESINWDDVYHKRIIPQFRPIVKDEGCCGNIDAEFLNMDMPRSVTEDQLRVAQQQPAHDANFDGFTFDPNREMVQAILTPAVMP